MTRNPILDDHAATLYAAALMNLSRTTSNVGIEVEDFVLNSLASGEAVLEPAEKEMGVIVADIGGGTTDIALYAQGSVWHTRVIPVGGFHVTNDIAIGLRVPYDVAEDVKLRYGDCRPEEIDPDVVFTVEPFGGEKIQVGRQDLAYVIEARVEEIFQLKGWFVAESWVFPPGWPSPGGWLAWSTRCIARPSLPALVYWSGRSVATTCIVPDPRPVYLAEV